MITAPHIIPYQRKYRNAVLSLLFYARRVHTHLDWYQAGQWLDMEGRLVRIAYDNDAIVGVMGVSEPLRQTSWIRMAAVRRDHDPARILGQIWQPLREQLVQEGIRSVSALVINDWITEYLAQLGFRYLEDVVTLYRTGTDVPPMLPHSRDLRIRNGYLNDLRSIVAVDHAAFVAPWQMSHVDIRHAQRQAASCTLAEMDGEVIGYQISTRHHTSGHLARLAVMPWMQGRRVGAVLLDQMIRGFIKRGVRSITVNTQYSNIRSQRLYERYGFERNGFDLPIWTQDLAEDHTN